MSGHPGLSRSHVLQLLATEATELLDSHSAGELAGLLALHPEFDASYFDASVAAIDLAMMPPFQEPLPDRLRDKVFLDAERFMEDRRESRSQ